MTTEDPASTVALAHRFIVPTTLRHFTERLARIVFEAAEHTYWSVPRNREGEIVYPWSDGSETFRLSFDLGRGPKVVPWPLNADSKHAALGLYGVCNLHPPGPPFELPLPGGFFIPGQGDQQGPLLSAEILENGPAETEVVFDYFGAPHLEEKGADIRYPVLTDKVLNWAREQLASAPAHGRLKPAQREAVATVYYAKELKTWELMRTLYQAVLTSIYARWPKTRPLSPEPMAVRNLAQFGRLPKPGEPSFPVFMYSHPPFQFWPEISYAPIPVGPLSSAEVESLRQAVAQLPTPSTQPPPSEATNASDESDANAEPWEAIPDHNWDKQAVKLWCSGHTASEISDAVGKVVVGQTVYNRLCLLRRLYPSAHIPIGTERRKMRAAGNR